MLCPYCNNEMAKGKIYGDRYRPKWTPDGDKTFLADWANCTLAFKNQAGGGFRRYRAEAYVCRKCRKLIADML